MMRSVLVSLLPQRLHRIDFHGAARREIAGEQGDENQQRRHAGESKRVSRARRIKQTGKKTCRDDRSHHSGTDADQHQAKAVPEN